MRRDLLWITPMALLPFGPRGALAGDWREKGGRGQFPSALSLLTGWVPLLQVARSGQMALHSALSVAGPGNQPSFLGGAVTPAAPVPTLTPRGPPHPDHTCPNRASVHLSLNFLVRSMPFVPCWDPNWPSPYRGSPLPGLVLLRFTLLPSMALGETQHPSSGGGTQLWFLPESRSVTKEASGGPWAGGAGEGLRAGVAGLWACWRLIN